MLAAEAKNMQVKQVAALLHACSYIQPAHNSEDEDYHDSPPKEAVNLIWWGVG